MATQCASQSAVERTSEGVRSHPIGAPMTRQPLVSTRISLLIASCCRTLVALLISTLFLADPAAAQFQQLSTNPIDAGEQRESRVELLREAVSEARWSFGNFKLDPFLAIKDASWVDNVFSTDDEETSDFTVTVGAGLRGFWEVGDTIIALHALPEYVWWQDLEDRRRLNGRYGAGLFGEFSRLAMEIETTLDEQQSRVLREVDQFTNTSAAELRARFQLRLYRSLGVFVEGTDTQLEYQLDEEPSLLVPNFAALDRDEERLRLGLTMRLRDRVDLSFGVESIEATFDPLGARQSNDGDAVFAALDYDSERFSATIEAASTELEASAATSLFPGFDDVTGSATLRLNSNDGRQQWRTRFSRELAYAVGAQFAYYQEETVGVAYRLRFAERIELSASYDVGTLDFVGEFGSSVTREDDFDSLGITLGIPLPYVSLTFGASRIEFDSTFPDADRTINQLSINVSLGSVEWPPR